MDYASMSLEALLQKHDELGKTLDSIAEKMKNSVADNHRNAIQHEWDFYHSDFVRIIDEIDRRICYACGQEIQGEAFHWGNHSFHSEDCFYEWDAAVMDKLRGKYS